MYELKFDPKLKHHYLIGVAMHGLKAGDKAGKVYLKYGPIYFTNEDIEKVLDSVIRSNDKLFNQSPKEANEIAGCSTLVANVNAMMLSSAANGCTIHHFAADFEIEDYWFETLVNVANISDHNKDLLKKARVK